MAVEKGEEEEEIVTYRSSSCSTASLKIVV